MTARLPSFWWPARELTSWLMPSSMSPSRPMHQMWWSKGEVPAAASGSNRPRSRRAAMRHADRVAQALAERAGGGLHAGRVAVLGVARGQAAPLAQRLQVVQARGRIRTGTAGCTGSGWSARTDRTNRSRPSHVGSVGSWRITLLEQQVRGGSQAHRGAGVARPAFSTASMARARTMSTACWSRSVHSRAGTSSVLKCSVSGSSCHWLVPVRHIPPHWTLTEWSRRTIPCPPRDVVPLIGRTGRPCWRTVRLFSCRRSGRRRRPSMRSAPIRGYALTPHVLEAP